jgi:DNA-directed RNA polymerase specialized sigma subunit
MSRTNLILNKYLYSLDEKKKLTNKELLVYYEEGKKEKVFEAFQLYIGKKGRTLEKDLNYRIQFEDIYQQLNLVLWNAVNKFDFNKSQAIVSYMTVSIDNAIIRMFNNKIKDSVLLHTDNNNELDRIDDIKEEFEVNGITIEMIKQILNKKEIEIINAFLLSGCHEDVAKELKTDVKYIYRNIRTIKNKVLDGIQRK